MLDVAATDTLFARFEAKAPAENQAQRRSAQIDIKIKETAFKSLVSCLLSAQSRDAMTARASAKLFSVASTPASIAALPEERIAELIKDCGLYRMKARNLKRLAAEIDAGRGGEVPSSRAGLMSLPGIGRKCADIMLRFVFLEPVAPVDTHVFRVSRRLGLAAGKTEAQLAVDLERRVPERFRFGAHIWLLNHGKLVCRSQRPRCPDCFLLDLCERNGVLSSVQSVA